MRMQTPYPGKLVDDEVGFRVLKCYIYKFIKNNIIRKPRFDSASWSFTTKKYFWFKTLRPMFGEYHDKKCIESFHTLKGESFIADEKRVYFMPQCLQEQLVRKRKSYIYCCSGSEAAEYLSLMGVNDLQSLTIFSSSFSWAIDLFDDTVINPRDEMDVLVYVKRP
jgi:hypothetical protein